MRSVPVTGERSVVIARSYDQIADFLLLDSHRASDRQIGALGVTHDWRISRRIVELSLHL
jgi:phosphoribosylanthranilate isomerase